MILLRHKGASINGAGPKSGQTAAHRAAITGKIESLRLLLNLGADFDLLDKNGKTAEQLAAPSVRGFFELIRLAKATIAARKAFYPEISTGSPDFEKWRDYLDEKEAFSIESRIKTIYDSYKKELAIVKKGLTNADYHKANQFVDQMNKCLSELRPLIQCQTTLSESLIKKHKVCACGEAAVASYAYLVHIAKSNLPVEEVSLFKTNPNNPKDQYGHAVDVLDRDQSKEIKDLSSWKNAFIIDSYNERFFFYQFIEQYDVDTGIKALDFYELSRGASNRLTPFPTILPFTETAALFNKFMKEAQEEIESLFLKRFQ